jgi:hypothetical protein
MIDWIARRKIRGQLRLGTGAGTDSRQIQSPRDKSDMTGDHHRRLKMLRGCDGPVS